MEVHSHSLVGDESSAQTLATLRAEKARPLPGGRLVEDISCHCRESKNETSIVQPAV